MATPRHDECSRSTPLRFDKNALMGCQACESVTRPRHRHRCEIVHSVCTLNGTIFPVGKRKPIQQMQLRRLRQMVVRSPTHSAHSMPLHQMHPWQEAAQGSVAEQLILRELRKHGQGLCVPLVWLPLWLKNFHEVFLGSVAPIHELIDQNLLPTRYTVKRGIVADVQLRPDLSYQTQSRPRFLDELLQPLSAEPLYALREVATSCSDAQAAALLRREGGASTSAASTSTCQVRCFRKLLFCDFKSIYDLKERYAKPFSPYQAGQWLVRRVLRTIWQSDDAAEEPPGPLRVLFVNRSALPCEESYSTCNRRGRPGTEGLHNIGELLASCAALGVARGVVCEVHDFGRQGLAADMRRVREVDVLVGTHGAGLANCFFMRPGASLIEVRPFGFEGKWPDQYFKSILPLEQHQVHFYQISTGDPSLMHPPPSMGRAAIAQPGWVTREGRDTELPWHNLWEVLRTVMITNRSRWRYEKLPTHTYVSWPAAGRAGAIASPQAARYCRRPSELRNGALGNGSDGWSVLC